MDGDYGPGSPTSNLLNLGLLGPNPAFGNGSQPSSEQSFGNNANSPSIETMMHAGALNAPSNISGSTSRGNFGSGQGMGSNLQAFQIGYSPPNMGATLQTQLNGRQSHHRGSGSGFLDGQSPVLGQDDHRLSMGSTGPYGHERQNSMTGSDSVSPHGGNMPFGDGSNENITSNPQGDGTDDRADGQSIPAWSELKTKAGKDRKRLPLACIACRRKKIRCSGEKPACKHCLRSRIPCVYKVTTRKAAPRTDYMAMLDKRLKRMEDRVIKILPRDEQSNVLANTSRAVVKPPLPPPLDKGKSGSVSIKKRGAETAFGDELDGWAAAKGAMNLDPNPKASGEDKTATQTVDGEEQSLLLEGQEFLPSKEIQEHLSEVFFDYVYGQSYHLLHKPSFMRKLAQGTVPPCLMLAVCAMAARFSTHPSLRTEPAFLRGEEWARPARDISLKRYDKPNLTILICYLILGLHEFGTCQGGRSWMFGGMAQRMAYALQLHRDLDHEPRSEQSKELKKDGTTSPGLTPTDREIRRRTMWACFQMDRFTSSGTERPLFVSELYIKAQLPVKEHYYEMEITGPTEDLEGNVPHPSNDESGELGSPRSNMGVAAYVIRLIGIWGKLISYMNLGGRERDKNPMWAEESVYQSIKRDILKWEEELPAILQYTPENLEAHSTEKIANQFLFMHIAHNQIHLFMNRFSLPMPSAEPQQCIQNMPPNFLAASARAALNAANQISVLVHQAADYHVTAPFAGYCAFYSSTVHVHGAFSRNKELAASSKEKLAWNVKYLTKMKKHWGMFHFMTENLREVYRRQADAARAGSHVDSVSVDMADGGQREGPDKIPIFQYGDWFDRYPHGVSGTDYEEPSAEVKKEPGSDGVLGQKSDLQTVEEFFSKMTPPSGRTVGTSNAPPANVQRRPTKKRNSGKTDGKQHDRTSSAGGQNSSQQQHRLSSPSQQLGDMQNSPQHQQQLQPEFTNFSPNSNAFPPGFTPPPNALLMPQFQAQQQQQQPSGVLSQLDRQMVLSSYAGMDINGEQANLGMQPNGEFSFDMSQFGPPSASGNAAANNGGYWSEPSTAWFMPFNLDPPTLGEDGNLFSSNIDWSTAFSSFDDGGFAGLPPTGLTPRAESGVDGGMEGMQ